MPYCVYRRYSHFQKLLDLISLKDYNVLKKGMYLPGFALRKAAKTKNRFDAFAKILAYLAAGDKISLHADEYSRAALLDFLTPDKVIREAVRDRHARREKFAHQDDSANAKRLYITKRVEKLVAPGASLDELDGGLSYYNVYTPNSAAKSKYAGPFLSPATGENGDAERAKLVTKWKTCP